jgi:hypothetical protein
MVAYLSRTAITATVNNAPTIIATTPGSVCNSGPVIIEATPSAGSVNWYDVCLWRLTIVYWKFILNINTTTTYYAKRF